MTAPDETRVDAAGSPPRAALTDKRIRPTGVLPRALQTWLMVALALVILLIIYLTGHREPVVTPRFSEPGQGIPSALPADRIRTYQQRVGEGEERLRQELDARTAEARVLSAPPASGDAGTVDPLAEERRRREYHSLFADNVALSRRPPDQRPHADTSGDLRAFEEMAARAWESAQRPAVPGSPVAISPAVSEPVPAPGGDPAATGPIPEAPVAPTETPPIPLSGPQHRLLEGTLIDTVLMNRLDGSFAGAVTCLVTTPVYSHSRQHVVIPAGARVLGSASPVQAWGASRLAVRFHRLVMPDGRTYSLERFTGLNQAGDAGLKDQVNRHYLQVFGASLAIGALSGLAQMQTRGGADPAYGFGDAYRQGVGGSLATSASRVLDRFLNVLPTITIREGHRVLVYLTSDLELPEYAGR
jgi:type IV secretion system protein TrbI